MDAKTIQDIIRLVNKSDLAEVEIETADVKLRVRRTTGEVIYHAPTYAPAPAQTAQRPASDASHSDDGHDEPAEESTDHLLTVRSPMIGTFYRAAGPDKDPYIKVGDNIEVGQALCMIEAMKLFNEIESEVSGRVVKILVDNAHPVEYDQPLLLIDPS